MGRNERLGLVKSRETQAPRALFERPNSARGPCAEGIALAAGNLRDGQWKRNRAGRGRYVEPFSGKAGFPPARREGIFSVRYP